MHRLLLTATALGALFSASPALAERASLGPSEKGGAALQYGFHHVAFTVGDLEASIIWYQRVLGFRVLERATIGGGTKAAQLVNGDLHVELFQASSPGSAPAMDNTTPGIKHVAWLVKDVDAFVTELKARGCEIIRVGKSPLGVPLAFIKDNSGNTIELIQPLKGDPPL